MFAQYGEEPQDDDRCSHNVAGPWHRLKSQPTLSDMVVTQASPYFLSILAYIS